MQIATKRILFVLALFVMFLYGMVCLKGVDGFARETWLYGRVAAAFLAGAALIATFVFLISLAIAIVVEIPVFIVLCLPRLGAGKNTKEP